MLRLSGLTEMPSPGDPAMPQFPAEESFLELLADTLETLDAPARGQFLQRYFRTTTQLELSEAQCLQYWDQTIARRRELSRSLARPISLKTALMDVLASANQYRVPILMEYDELKKLQMDAATDPLTGLYNRRLFTEYFEKELNRARRHSQQVALIIMDLHRFKEVNDRHGHPQGDEVLRLAAATLRKSLRTSDYAFRIGGDEFALLLPQTDVEQASGLGRRIRAAFEEAMQSLNLTVSVTLDHGVAVYPQDGEEGDVVIRVADERLYRLKHVNHRQADAQQPPAEQRGPSLVKPGPTPAPATQKPAPSVAPREPVRTETPSKSSTAANGPSYTAPQKSRTPVPPSVPTPTASRSGPEHRRAERVSMAGTRAYAVLGEDGRKTARVIDLGFGGVGLQVDDPEELPETFSAVLHVPILPPVRVTLRRVYLQKPATGSARMGCSFIS
ncbi:MAG TPA: GGDEF domain-containing protein [Candidatus Dormibacteraeota bacterium]|nr:GGDEF domain-containing protein [Candidatus Dormibacteraeota bacterium]